MKRLLLVLLLLPCLVWAGQGVIPTGHVVTISAGDECTGFLICQNAENTGYDNSETWSETTYGGTINEDYTTTALRGSQSIALTASTSGEDFYSKSPAFSATSPIYTHFMFRMSSLPADCCPAIFRIYNGTTVLAYLRIRDNGTFSAYHGDDYGDTSLSINTTYHIWVDYTAGSGSNGVLNVYIGTDTNKPGSATIALTSGTSTASATNVGICNKDISSGPIHIFDQILVKSSSFSTVP